MATIAFLVVVLTSLALAAPPASALPVTGRGHGFYSASGGGFWLGSWRLADGTLAFCVNTERSTPNGQEFSYADGAALGWYDSDAAARLAYIARTWAGTTDPTTAAAGQIATWTLTGLGRHTQEELAAKAGPHAGAVLDLTRRMLEETERSASRSVSASLKFDRSADGEVLLTPTLTVDRIASGPGPAPAGGHAGTATVTGATFDGGLTTAVVRNGDAVPIHVESEKAIVDVSASVTFDGLNYGNALTMAVAQGGAQNLLTSRGSPASASTALTTTLPSTRSFQPVVSTRTSTAVAEAGATVFDTLVIGVEPNESSLSEWPVIGEPGGPFSPVPVTVRSRLLGPFDGEIVAAKEPPSDAPVVCEVSLIVTTGPGEYSTPSCILPGVGSYVWVESIIPTDTAVADGGTRILPWTSPFGVTSEITTVPPPAAPPVETDQPDAVSRPTPMLPETGAEGDRAISLVLVALALLTTGTACMIRRRAPDRTGAQW
jgi:hypothetical protein